MIPGILSRLNQNHWLPFRNDSGETVPPYAVMRVTGTETVHGQTILTIGKPDGSNQNWYAINGPGQIAANSIAGCTLSPSAIIRVESGTPSNGDEWGPSSGNWGIGSSGSRFFIFGSKTSGRNLNLVEAVQTTSASKTFWGLTQSNWVDNGTSCDHVPVKKCDDCEGSNPSGDNINVLLPKANDADPNVIATTVIAYAEADDGTYVCVSDYMDDAIGTVKMWTGSYLSVPSGWAVCNGQDNSPANGGTGINLIEKFVRGAKSTGSRGGSETHTHEIDVFVSPHSAVQVALALKVMQGILDVQIGDHTQSELSHEHPIGLDTVSNGWPADYESWTPDQAARLNCTNPPVDDSADCTTAPTWGPLNHEVTVEVKYPNAEASGYASALSHNDAYAVAHPEEHLPPYVDIIFIERLNNAA